MKIALYSPYLDTFGGGERYMMTIAEVFCQDNIVDILLNNHLLSFGAEYLKKELSARFDLNLTSTNFIKGPIGKESNAFERLFFLNHYDLFFYLTDGSFFLPTAKKNILHIQSPLAGESGKGIWGRLKLKGWDLAIYNSKFTKENSQQNWPISSVVLYPPVDIARIKPLKKKKYILSVGRFFGYLKDKKQEVLIKIFRDLYERNQVKDWNLYLVGSAGKGDEKYLAELENLSKGIPVKFYPNLDFDSLVKLYGESSIYWHAAGFGEIDPTKMEHFGISTVEAMAAGCVPVVTDKGGQKEIVESKKNGYLWNTLEELKKYTISLIKNQKLMSHLSKNALLASQKFAKKEFEKEIIKLIQK